MYLREAVIRCRDLEDEIAKIYQELAAQHAANEALSDLWSDLADDERMHSRLFAALLACQDVLEDDGPFLVDLPLRIGKLRRLLDEAYLRVREGIGTDEALQLAERIESSEIDEVAADVVELSLDSLHRMMELVEVGFGRDEGHKRRIEVFRPHRLAGAAAQESEE